VSSSSPISNCNIIIQLSSVCFRGRPNTNRSWSEEIKAQSAGRSHALTHRSSILEPGLSNCHCSASPCQVNAHLLLGTAPRDTCLRRIAVLRGVQEPTREIEANQVRRPREDQVLPVPLLVSAIRARVLLLLIAAQESHPFHLHTCPLGPQRAEQALEEAVRLPILLKERPHLASRSVLRHQVNVLGATQLAEPDCQPTAALTHHPVPEKGVQVEPRPSPEMIAIWSVP
jgi:hypothetical protein